MWPASSALMFTRSVCASCSAAEADARVAVPSWITGELYVIISSDIAWSPIAFEWSVSSRACAQWLRRLDRRALVVRVQVVLRDLLPRRSELLSQLVAG